MRTRSALTFSKFNRVASILKLQLAFVASPLSRATRFISEFPSPRIIHAPAMELVTFQRFCSFPRTRREPYKFVLIRARHEANKVFLERTKRHSRRTAVTNRRTANTALKLRPSVYVSRLRRHCNGQHAPEGNHQAPDVLISRPFDSDNGPSAGHFFGDKSGERAARPRPGIALIALL